MVGKTLITKQSGDIGFPCNSVYIVEKLDIAKEMYVAITIDRNAGAPVIVYSTEGGMSIEDVAENNPEMIHKILVDMKKGLNEEELIKAAGHLGLSHLVPSTVFLFKHLY
jgi:succinyl-CoA synthetase beta subunit